MRRTGPWPVRVAFALALALALLAPALATHAGAEAAGTWTVIPTAGAPGPRNTPAVVWTGAELLLWGGTGGDALKLLPIGTGGRYNPVTRTWRPMASGGPVTTGAPSAIWTGTDAIIWSDQSWWGSPEGAIYDPTADRWKPLPTAGEPGIADSQQAVVWTGQEMIVWAGPHTSARYNPTTNAWSSVSSVGAPARTRGATAVWTGQRILVWGGENPTTGRANTGAAYDPASDTWTPLSTVGAPSPRTDHAAVWTGTKMLVWGGQGNDPTHGILGDGAAYDPATDSWRPLASADAPSPRIDFAAGWLGDGMVIWGGDGGKGPIAGGAVYRPATNSWQALPTAGAPGPRVDPAAIWTGHELLLWGGATAFRDGLANGAAYTPPSLPTCRFVLGFAALHAALPATIGDCLENEQHNPVNGDGLQHTTSGLLVWRKSDDFTAFTDGYRTWVDGPSGVQERLNTQRFRWEANPGDLPVAS